MARQVVNRYGGPRYIDWPELICKPKAEIVEGWVCNGGTLWLAMVNGSFEISTDLSDYSPAWDYNLPLKIALKVLDKLPLPALTY